MSARRLALRVLPERLAICRLEPDAPLPGWLFHDEARLFSLTRTPEETSIVCPEADVPPSIARVASGYRALALRGPFALDSVGVLAALTTPLAAAQIPVFALSTWDTDLLLVRESDLDRALAALAPHAAIETPPA